MEFLEQFKRALRQIEEERKEGVPSDSSKHSEPSDLLEKYAGWWPLLKEHDNNNNN